MTPENVIEKWADYFNAGDLEGITSLYHRDSTLLPTFLPKLLSSKEQISGYFIAAIEGKASIEVNVGQSIKKVISEDAYLMTGSYVFCLPSKGEEKYESWYSFLIDLSVDSPIRHHHSSRVPFDFDLSH
jgi:hypothetical protein